MCCRTWEKIQLAFVSSFNRITFIGLDPQVLTLDAHCLHCFSSRQSPAAFARLGSKGLSFRSNHLRFWKQSQINLKHMQTCVCVCVKPTLSWEKLTGSRVSLLLYRSRCCRLVRFPRSSGRQVSWFLLRSTLTRWVRLQKSGCVKQKKNPLNSQFYMIFKKLHSPNHLQLLIKETHQKMSVA